MATPLRAGVLSAPFIALFFVFIAEWSGWAPSLLSIIDATLAWLMGTLGWAFIGVGIAVVIATITAYATLGSYRIGGPDTRPGHSAFTAVAVGVAASTSLGLLFWATAEPIYHVHQPPRSMALNPLSYEAQIFARSATMFHWAVLAPLLNALCMIVFGLTVQNLGRRPTIDGALFRNDAPRTAGSILDGLLVFAATLVVVGAFASCTLALSGEMTRFGTRGPIPAALFAIALAMVFVIFVAGARPIRTVYSVLARAGLILMLLMMAATFLIGPMGTILGGGLVALWQMIWSLPAMFSFTGLSTADPWPQTWTMTHWGNAMMLAPLTGLFLSRAARGFLVGQAVLYFAIIPAAISMLWIIVFGGLALSVDEETSGSVWAAIASGGADNATYAALWSLPGGDSLVVGFLILMALAFVTFAAAILHAVMRLCAPGADNDPATPGARARIATVWCAALGVTGWGLASHGIGPLVDTLARLGSLPALLVTVGLLAAAIRLLMRPQNLKVVKKAEPVQIDFDLGDVIANDDDDLDIDVAAPPRRRKRRKSA